jgi:integrase
MQTNENAKNQVYSHDSARNHDETIRKILEICRRVKPVQCSEKTLNEYAKIYFSYLDTDQGKRLGTITSKNTYWKHRRSIEIAVKGMSEKILATSNQEGGGIAKDYMRVLEKFIELFRVNDLLQPPKGCPIENPKPRKSKRGSLSGLPKNWQEIFWKSIPLQSKYYPQVAILILSGARPDEIETGVQVESNHETKELLISIHGSKRGQDDENGQKWRRLRIDFGDADPSGPEVYLAQLTRDTSRIIQCEKTKRLTDYVTYWGTKLFGKRDNSISPYSFRNQFCSDLKRDPKFGKMEIAQMMGHRSDRTQKRYGLFNLGKGGRGIKGVEASDEVRMYEQSGELPWASKSDGKMTN